MLAFVFKSTEIFRNVDHHMLFKVDFLDRFNPVVIEHFSDARTLFKIGPQALADERFGFVRYARHVVIVRSISYNEFVPFSVAPSTEGRASSQ